MRKILVAAAGASALVLGTTTVALASKTVQTLASAGSHVVSPVQPLGPAALASALRSHPFPTVGLGYTVSFAGSQVPPHRGDPWVLTWLAPATAPEVDFQFFLEVSKKGAVADWNQMVRTVTEFRERVFDISP